MTDNRPAFSIPRGAFRDKPKHGEECNRCGLCCIGSLCPLGMKVFNRAIGPCPALSFDENKQSICGLAATPEKFAPMTALKKGIAVAQEAAAHLIGTGFGCDCRINGETPNRSFYDRLRVWDRKNVVKTRIARKLWGL
jgi:hypothetical protein